MKISLYDIANIIFFLENKKDFYKLYYLCKSIKNFIDIKSINNNFTINVCFGIYKKLTQNLPKYIKNVHLSSLDTTSIYYINNVVILSLYNTVDMTETQLKILIDNSYSTLQEVELGLFDNLTNQGVKYISKCKNLHTLNLNWCQDISDEGIEPVIINNPISNLNVCQTQISGKLFEYIISIGKITKLNIGHTYCIPYINFKCLEYYNKLVHLDIRGYDIHENINLLKNLSNIKYLNLCQCHITDKQLKYFTNNVILNISQNDITDKGMKYLVNNKVLIDLDIGWTQVTDIGIKYLLQCKKLKYIRADNCNDITDKKYNTWIH